jgi:hypothetical protein
MTDNEKMLAKQFLLRVRKEGYSLGPKTPQFMASEMNTDIYRNKTLIGNFNDRQLGDDIVS